MDIKEFRIDGSKHFKLQDFDPDATPGLANKAEGLALLEENKLKMADLQDRFYAHAKESLLIIFQGMDAAGKDSAIKHVMQGVNPQGVSVVSFKQPSKLELDHDYMWRCWQRLPLRGQIGIFNRSYYEEVLVARVHDLPQGQPLPEHAKADVWAKRYEQITNLERYLYQNGTTVIKFLLNISKDEQAKRFLDRINDPQKNWKFSQSDIKEREYWDSYMKAFEHCVNNTATSHAPWYVVPCNHKWYEKALISQVIIHHLEQIDPHYPKITDAARRELGVCRELLMEELGWDQEKEKKESKKRKHNKDD